MPEINQNINPNYFQQQAIGYGASNQDVKQAISNNTVVKPATDEKDEYRKLAMTPFIGAGIYYGMSKYNKSCNGKYENTVLAKIGRFGDKVAHWKIFDNKVVNTVVDKSVNIKNKFFNDLVPKSKVLNAFFNNPTKPQVQMVVLQASGPKAELAKNAADKLWELTEQGKNSSMLEKFGYKDKAGEFEKLVKHAHEEQNIPKILNILKSQGETVEKTATKGFKIPFTQTYVLQGLKEKMNNGFSYSECANKIEALNGKGSGAQATTRLGKFLPKALHRGLEGLTQSSSGGMFAALLGAYFVAEAVNNTIKADGFNEKRKTLPENLIYLMGWYITMPISIRLMHHVGGLQYIGVKDVAGYRKKLDLFNSKASGLKVEGNKFVKMTEDEMKAIGGRFKDKEAYKTALKDLKGTLNEGAKWYHKPFRLLGRIMSVGLEQIRPYVATEGAKDSNKILETLKKGKFQFKQGAGYPMRFLTFAMVTSPFFAKIGAKISHVIFGKPKKSVLDEGKEEPKTTKPTNGAQYIGQPIVQNQNANLFSTTPQQQLNSAQMSANNINNQNRTLSSAPIQQQVAQNSTTQQPAQTSSATNTTSRTYTYIPSSTPVQLQPQQQDNTKLNNAIYRFDKIANNIQNQYSA